METKLHDLCIVVNGLLSIVKLEEPFKSKYEVTLKTLHNILKDIYESD
jgi:hypothetical protein